MSSGKESDDARAAWDTSKNGILLCNTMKDIATVVVNDEEMLHAMGEMAAEDEEEEEEVEVEDVDIAEEVKEPPRTKNLKRNDGAPVAVAAS